MGKYVARLADDAYVEWSTIVDAPVTQVLARDAAAAEWGEDRVARADRNGTSVRDSWPAGRTPEEIVSGNRAGPDESELTVAEILDAYAEAGSADRNRDLADAALAHIGGVFRAAVSACPYCGAVNDAQEEVAHMNAEHPDIVADRLRNAGFAYSEATGEWLDTLADGNG